MRPPSGRRNLLSFRGRIYHLKGGDVKIRIISKSILLRSRQKTLIWKECRPSGTKLELFGNYKRLSVSNYFNLSVYYFQCRLIVESIDGSCESSCIFYILFTSRLEVLRV